MPFEFIVRGRGHVRDRLSVLRCKVLCSTTYGDDDHFIKVAASGGEVSCSLKLPP